MIEHRKMLMSDYSLNQDLVDACKNEISTFCANGEEKGGKTLHCLFRNAKNFKNKETFSSECVAQLRKLVKVADAGEDARVDSHLIKTCQPVIKGACKDVQLGGGRVLDCLMRNIGTNEMNEDCEERLLEIQFFVSRDWK
jgi:Golgi apparatus protein 1